jgi:hypothetical protein
MAKSTARALPVPDLQSQGEYIAPRNPIEEKMAQIWGEVLKLERVSIEDNFFELGDILCWQLKLFLVYRKPLRLFYPCVICLNRQPLLS